ncbi:hypothetical protein ASZ90_015775 [hydrocarbon metagenome]|uniref:Uncharacterized protein n=1 Tax=hydrocarbon metagenome TaxID=938273 RepID=A0A0W8F2G8_9ZZZZ
MAGGLTASIFFWCREPRRSLYRRDVLCPSSESLPHLS